MGEYKGPSESKQDLIMWSVVGFMTLLVISVAIFAGLKAGGKQYMKTERYVEDNVKKVIDTYKSGEAIFCLKYKNVKRHKSGSYPVITFSQTITNSHKDFQLVTDKSTMDILNTFFYDDKNKKMYPAYNCRVYDKDYDYLKHNGEIFSYGVPFLKKGVVKDNVIFSRDDYEELERIRNGAK